MTESKKFGEIRNARTGEVLVQMFGPGRDNDALSIGLRMLTHRLSILNSDLANPNLGFGGQFGYGADFENDTFLMHPYCGCDKEGECPWCTGCRIYQERNACQVCADGSGYDTVKRRRAAPLELRCDYAAGRGIFARFAPWTWDCERPYYDPPHFWHKPSDYRVRWYKYIGRENKTNRDISGEEWVGILRSVLTSIGRPGLDVAMKEYADAESQSASFP